MKTERQIEKELINDIVTNQDRVTYFGKGSVIRALVHSVSRRLGEIWFDYSQKMKTMFLSTAQGSDLDGYGSDRGMSRLGASPSKVLLVFKGSNGTVIPENTQVTGDHGFVFETLAAATIGTDGDYNFGSEGLGCTVVAQSTASGAGTRVAENTINQMVTPITGVSSVSNPLPAYYGADEETDEEFRYRIKHRISILNNGTTAFVAEACKEVNEDINRVYVEKVGGDVLNVYTVTRSNTFLSSSQKSAIKAHLNDKWKILPQINIVDIPFTSINVYIKVRPVDGASLQETFVSIADDIMDFLDFRRWPFGENVSSDDILNICLNNEAVDDIDVTTFSPSDNIDVANNSIPMLENITMINMDNETDTINLDLNPSY